MKIRTLPLFILILSLCSSGVGQVPSATSQQGTPGDDEVVRITTNLVQVDAVVIDKNGKQVTDLKADDFEILEDGRSQPITNLSYIAAGGSNDKESPEAGNDAKPQSPPPAPLRPEQIHRTIALVADDLGFSPGSASSLRRALRKVVAEDIQPTDLAALLRTAGGVGILQQFTSDKRLLYKAIDRIRWNGSLNRVDPFEAIAAAPIVKFGAGPALESGGLGAPVAQDKFAEMREKNRALREDVYTFGTINALNNIINGLRRLPGRKSILLFSDSLKLTEANIDAMRRLADHANRASVVIYTMNTGGMPVPGLAAADATAGNSSDEVSALLATRSASVAAGQSALTFLSQQTGGLDIHNTNDLSGGIKRALNDQKGYYLLGYRPDKSTFDEQGVRRFHRLEIRVKRQGLSVRSRRGFYGATDEKGFVPRNRSEELIAAMTSPFQTSGIDVRLTSLFDSDPGQGAVMRSLLHIDAKPLQFTATSDGWQRAKIEVAAITFDGAGKMIDKVAHDEIIEARGASYQRLLRNGLTYSFDVPVRKAGGYQLRIAVRDPATKLVGSASQFIEVPDLKSKQLALSGIYARGVALTAAASPPVKKISQSPSGGLLSMPPEIDEAAGQSGEAVIQPSAAIRRLSRGMALDYSFTVFNASVDKRTRRPSLQTQIIIFRDDQQILTRNIQPFDESNSQGLDRLAAKGRLELGADVQPGEYNLQIIVTDLLADNKSRTATQWIDFEVVK